MDKLLEEIKKRKARTGKTSEGWVRKGEVLQREAQEYILEEQKRDEERQRKLQEQLKEIEEKHREAPKKTTQEMPAKAAHEAENEPEIDVTAIKLSKKEIINKLREHRQPITLFGEDDAARYKRLCKCEHEAGGILEGK